MSRNSAPLLSVPTLLIALATSKLKQTLLLGSESVWFLARWKISGAE